LGGYSLKKAAKRMAGDRFPGLFQSRSDCFPALLRGRWAISITIIFLRFEDSSQLAAGNFNGSMVIALCERL
jgi:hypothetical protein